jgi:adenylosuccinate synthase
VKAYCIADLAFGDCSKGATTDALCRSLPVDLIVRYNGGCQAAHHVQLNDGRSHCFSQFGAGMLANYKVRTHLSRFMLVEPLSMMKEAAALSNIMQDIWWRTTVDGNAVIVTPFHRALNRFRERARGVNAHGSCGRGIGVAREMHLKYGDEVLFAKDTQDFNRLTDKLCELKEIYLEEINDHAEYNVWEEDEIDIGELVYQYMHWSARIVDGLEPAETMVFEGAQGVMLDEKHGTAPHNTWTNTTFENADTLLDEVGCTDRMRIGCLRTYYTRHGAGPFPTEDNTLDLPEPHNGNDGFQGKFRVGRFDYQLAAKALEIVKGVDMLSISHLDYLPRLGVEEKDFLEHLEYQLNTPVGMLGRGPTAAHRTINLEVAV